VNIFTRPRGIRTRLTLAYIFVLTIILVGFGAVSFRILKNRLDNALSRELAERGAALRGYLHFEDGEVSLNFDPTDYEQAYFVQSSTRFYQIYDINDARLLKQSQELDLLGLDLTAEEVRAMASGPRFYDVETDEGPLRFRNEVLTLPSGEAYLFQIGASMRQMQEALGHYFQLLLWLIPVALGLASLTGWWAAGRGLRPAVDLASRVQRIEISNVSSKPLPIRGTGDELDQLATAFNDMLRRLARTIDEMKQFTASVSHELRTPLSILRGEAEVALMQAGTVEDFRRVISSQLEEFDKLTRMINQLLTLARAEAGEIALERRPVDLCQLVTSLAEQMVPVAESRHIKLMTECQQETVFIAGDASWLERVVLNLLDNAMKFTVPGGSISVSVGQSGSSGIVEFRDTGIGISSEALPHIFERFYQADPARSSTSSAGVGLGLSLVKWIIDQHSGRIDVTSKPGAGSTFRIALPLIKTT
jgi:heavy metal sensor kinase